VTNTEALEIAKKELARAIYESETYKNPGLAKIWSNKADWLGKLIYLAEQHIESVNTD
jgi:hypothetical protein